MILPPLQHNNGKKQVRMVGNTTAASTGKIMMDMKCPIPIMPGRTFAPGDRQQVTIGGQQ